MTHIERMCAAVLAAVFIIAPFYVEPAELDQDIHHFVCPGRFATLLPTWP